jgi:acyl-CoA thioesterase
VTTRFEADTGLRSLGDGAFEGRIDPAWRIVRGANGGHIAAILLRGLVLRVDDPRRTPASLTVHFTRVPREDVVRIETNVEREGRSMSTVTGRMLQDDKLVAFGVASFSAPRSGPEFFDLGMPEVPGPEDLEPNRDRDDFPFGRQFDFRPALGPTPGTTERSDRAELGIWLRLREPQVVEHVVVTQLLDAYAPAVFAKLGAGGGGAGVPTVEMTYYYREPLPLEGARLDDWYLGIFRTTTARAGSVEEDGWLWSRDGRLVAQSRQLAIVMTS